jgi:hypothetical protein
MLYRVPGTYWKLLVTGVVGVPLPILKVTSPMEGVCTVVLWQVDFAQVLAGEASPVLPGSGALTFELTLAVFTITMVIAANKLRSKYFFFIDTIEFLRGAKKIKNRWQKG